MTYDEILKAYPTVCRTDAEHVQREPFAAYKFECGSGWVKIIEEAAKALAETTPYVYFGQVKEKFGSMRMYLSYDYDENKEPKATDEQLKQCNEIARKAEDASCTTCESCGASTGSVISVNGWLSCTCDICLIKVEKNVIEDILKHKDDGLKSPVVVTYKCGRSKGLKVLDENELDRFKTNNEGLEILRLTKVV